MDVRALEALQTSERPFGSVGLLHEGPDLRAWWIRKDDEDVDPDWSVMAREDLLYVVEGTLRLELEGDEPRDVRAGECVVIPAGRRFRGYRWPRHGGPCLFLAVTAASD